MQNFRRLTSIVVAPWLFTLAANVSMLAEPHCMGTYSIWESMIYWAGVLPQSYSQVIELCVWLALFRSPGVLPAEKARPRLFDGVSEGELLLNVLVGVLVLDVIVLLRAARKVERKSARRRNNILGGQRSQTRG